MATRKRLLVISYTNFKNYINGYMTKEDIEKCVFVTFLPEPKNKCPEQSTTNSSQT